MVTEIFKEVTNLDNTYMYLTMFILMYFLIGFVAFHIKTAIAETKKHQENHESIKPWTYVYWMFNGLSLINLALFVSVFAFYIIKFYKLFGIF